MARTMVVEDAILTQAAVNLTLASTFPGARAGLLRLLLHPRCRNRSHNFGGRFGDRHWLRHHYRVRLESEHLLYPCEPFGNVQLPGVENSTANGLIARYNFLENAMGTAYIATPCGCSDIQPANWEIYGNVLFYNASESYAGAAGAGDGWLSIWNFSNFGGYLKVYNNTIAIN